MDLLYPTVELRDGPDTGVAVEARQQSPGTAWSDRGLAIPSRGDVGCRAQVRRAARGHRKSFEREARRAQGETFVNPRDHMSGSVLSILVVGK